MFKIDYTINTSYLNSKSGDTIKLHVDLSAILQIDVLELNYRFDNTFFISQNFITQLLMPQVTTYCDKYDVPGDQMTLDEYSVVSNTPNVSVYFQYDKDYDPSKFSTEQLCPAVYAYIEAAPFDDTPPKLIGELIGENTIKWSWDDTESNSYAHTLLDTKNNIIAQIPLYVSSYIETDLKYNTTYTRRLFKFDSDNYSKNSDDVSILTSKITDNFILGTYLDKMPTNFNNIAIGDIDVRLKAFHSGIGDGLDLLIEKQSQEDFYDEFNLYANIYGKYDEEIKHYGQVSFDYRLNAYGSYTKQSRDGKMTFIAKAYPINELDFTIRKYYTKPVPISYYVESIVGYYKKDDNGFYQPETKTIMSETFTYNFLVPLTEENKVSISNGATLKSIMTDVANNDPDIMPSLADGLLYKLSCYVIRDNYFFDLANKYSTSSPGVMDSSHIITETPVDPADAIKFAGKFTSIMEHVMSKVSRPIHMLGAIVPSNTDIQYDYWKNGNGEDALTQAGDALANCNGSAVEYNGLRIGSTVYCKSGDMLGITSWIKTADDRVDVAYEPTDSFMMLGTSSADYGIFNINVDVASGTRKVLTTTTNPNLTILPDSWYGNSGYQTSGQHAYGFLYYVKIGEATGTTCDNKVYSIYSNAVNKNDVWLKPTTEIPANYGDWNSTEASVETIHVHDAKPNVSVTASNVDASSAKIVFSVSDLLVGIQQYTYTIVCPDKTVLTKVIMANTTYSNSGAMYDQSKAYGPFLNPSQIDLINAGGKFGGTNGEAETLYNPAYTLTYSCTVSGAGSYSVKVDTINNLGQYQEGAYSGTIIIQDQPTYILGMVDSGLIGSVCTCANFSDPSKLIYDENSEIYTYGYCDGNMFYFDKDVRKIKFFDASMGDSIVLIDQEDLVCGKDLINIAGDKIPENTVGVKTMIIFNFIDEDFVFTSRLDTTKEQCLIGCVNRWYSTDLNNPLKYLFNDVKYQINETVDDLFENLEDERMYKIVITPITTTLGDDGINSNIFVLNTNGKNYYNINPNIDLVYSSENKDFILHFYSAPRTIISTYNYVFPTQDSNPWHGIVNGHYEYTASGKKDQLVHLPSIRLPEGVLDSNFKILIDNISQPSAFINFKFYHGDISTNSTKMNGDIVDFSSEYTVNITQSNKRLLETQSFTKLSVDSIDKEVIKTITVKKPLFDPNINYTGFYVEYINDNPDVRITSADTNIVFTNDICNLNVTLKGDESATALWKPKIHNGFYYLNQDEFYLTSSFDGMTGNFTQSPVVTYKEDIASCTIRILLTKDSDVINNNSIILKTSADFLDTVDHMIHFDFDSITKKCYSAPIIDGVYYKEYPTSIDYITSVFAFKNTVTAYTFLNIEYAYRTNIIAEMRIFVNESNSWSPYYPIIDSLPMTDNTLPPSDYVQFKFTLNNVVEYTNSTFYENASCREEFIDEMSTDLNDNHNISVIADRIDYSPIDPGYTTGLFTSTLLDYGDLTTKTSFKVHKTSGATFSVCFSNDINNTYNFTQCTEILNGETGIISGIGRYVRYKVDILTDQDNVKQIYREVQCKVISNSTLPGFGDIELDYSNRGSDIHDLIIKDFNEVIPYDAQPHTILNNIYNAFEPNIISLGYTKNDISDVMILNNTDTTISLEFTTNSDSSIIATSKIIQTETSVKTKEMNFDINNNATITPIPQQFAPVIVENNSLGSFKNVCFYDEHNNLTLETTDIKISNNQSIFQLTNTSIDTASLVVTIDNVLIDKTDYILKDDNIVEFNYVIKKDTIIEFTYKIKNSFIVQYLNENEINIKLNTNTPSTKANVIYETDLVDNRRSLDHLSLNTLFNVYNEGFIYLTDENSISYNLNIYCNSSIINGDGLEKAFIYIQVTDKEGNAVNNEQLIISTDNDKTVESMILSSNRTDINGVMRVIYSANSPSRVVTLTVSSIPNPTLSNSIKITCQ